MKDLKIAFLFFCAFNLTQASSFRSYIDFRSYTKIEKDSLVFHLENMKNTSLSGDLGLRHANEALKLAKKEKLVSEIKEILNYKIYFFGKLRKYDSAIHTSKIILRSLHKGDSKGLASHYSKMAYYYNMNYQKDSAYLYYRLSNEIYLKFGDTIKIGENLTHITMIQSDLGDYSGSDETGIKALKYLNERNMQYLSFLYNSLAITSKKQHDFKDAIYWYNKALSISTNKLDSISILNNKSIVLRYLEQYDESISLLTELLKDPILEIKPRTKAKILDNKAYAIWLNNNNSNVFPEFLLAKKIRLEEKDSMGLISSYAHLSDYYRSKNKETSLSYASEMYKLASNQKSPQDQLEALLKLINLDNTLRAKEYYTSYIRISDSLIESEKQTKNKFAKIKYDSKKNREENLRLKVISSEKELELEKAKNRNIIGAVSSGTFFLCLIGFGFYRKQKFILEKRAEVYKTETRIAKKIHDEVANNVVNIMNKIQYTEEPKENLLDDLEEVYFLTRDISHQNKTVETGNKFENFLKALLTSFNTSTTTVILKDIHKIELKLLASDKQIEIYRILHELMVNMQKHSKATLVAVSFKNNKNQYSINYSDNGVGLTLKELSLKNGLKNVETRIKSINGVITFETSVNNGFKAFISFKR